MPILKMAEFNMVHQRSNESQEIRTNDCIAGLNCTPYDDNPDICHVTRSNICNCEGTPVDDTLACHLIEPKGIIVPCSKSSGFVDKLCYCNNDKTKIAQPGDLCEVD